MRCRSSDGVGRLVAGGLAVGLVASVFLARLVASRLFGVAATDPLTLVGALLVLLGVARVAALIPPLEPHRSTH